MGACFIGCRLVGMSKTQLRRRKGTDPEEFMLDTFDCESGTIKKMLGPMSEAQIREYLTGMPAEELDAKIEAARRDEE